MKMKNVLALILAVVILAAAPMALAARISFDDYTLAELYNLRTKLDQEIQKRIAESYNHIAGHTGYIDLGDVSVALDGYSIYTDAGKSYLVVAVKWQNNTDAATSYYLHADIEAYQNGVGLDETFIRSVDDNYDRKILPGYSLQVKEIFELPNTKDPVTLIVRQLFSYWHEYTPQQFVIQIK